MHVEVEPQPYCITKLRVELPPERVTQERQKIIGDFAGQVRLPGYRPGKAPRALVESKFKKDIADELKRQLVGTITREAIKEKNLRVLSVADVEEVDLGLDGSLRFTARLITAPEFELPEYKGIPVKIPAAELSEADVDAALERLRARLSDFEDITDRGLEMGDFAVLDFTGRLEGQPVSEAAPKAPRELAGRENFWIKLGPATLVPGFCEPLIGARAGETRDFAVELPADIPTPELAGKKLDYTVKVREVKRQVLPEINDEFAAKLLPGKNLAEARAKIREDLESQRKTDIEELKRRQMITHLLNAVDFELPTEFVRAEAQRILGEIVRENQERGVSDEEIREHQKELINGAGQAAHDRLKGSFILVRIAEKEGIKITGGELEQRVQQLASRYGMSRDKMLDNLRERDALGHLEEEILTGKTLAFLGSNASVETVAAAPPDADASEEPLLAGGS